MMLVQVIILFFVCAIFGELCPPRCECDLLMTNISCTKQNLTAKNIEMMQFPLNISILNLEENQLTYFPTGIFRNYTKLKSVDLGKNLMDIFPSNLSSEIPSLDTIFLNNNRFKEIKENDLDGFDKIISLDLHGNLLTTIPANAFKKCTSLLHLYLKSNQIDKLDRKSFATLIYLRTLSLAENKLSSIPLGIFDDFKVVEVISLNYNNLTLIPEGLFSSLGTLFELYLANNSIYRISPRAFKNQDFITLDLSGNVIQTLSMDSFVDAYADDLLLEDNPIVCDCKLNLIISQLKVKGSCQFPHSLEGLPLVKVLTDNYLNCTVCSINPCLNGGTCNVTNTKDYVCNCDRQYTGVNCETKRPACELNQCLNNATCINVQSIEGYFCNCTLNYKGTHCEAMKDCLKQPCLNNGLCIENTKGYHCNCTTNYRGENCQDVKACLSNPCNNKGICIDNDSQEKYLCKCQTGFHGNHCQQKVLAPGWIALIVIAALSLLIVGGLIYVCKSRHKSATVSEKGRLTAQTVNNYTKC